MVYRHRLARYVFSFIFVVAAVYPRRLDVECGGRLCRNGGSCHYLGNFSMCLCTGKFWGYDCSLPKCNPFCGNRGECVIESVGRSSTRHVCRCRSGFAPPTCTKRLPIIDCGKNTCFNNAACATLPNGTKACQCVGPYVGANCRIPRCIPRCKNGGTCVEKQPGYHVCICRARFSGKDCSQSSLFTGRCLYERKESAHTSFIMSPNEQFGLKTYFPKSNCDFIVRGTKGSKLRLQLLKIDLEVTPKGVCGKDRLEVFDSSDRKMAYACGSSKFLILGSGSKVTTIETKDLMRLRWITDRSVEGSGFYAKVNFLGNQGPGQCKPEKPEICLFCPDQPCRCCHGYVGRNCNHCQQSECIVQRYAISREERSCPIFLDLFLLRIQIGRKRCFRTKVYMANQVCECCSGFRGVCGNCTSDGSSQSLTPALMVPWPASDICGRSTGTARNMLIEERIVGGRRAKEGEWPWQVAVKFQGSVICGGTLISDQLIITAAHCLDKDDSISQYSFLLGTTVRGNGSGLIMNASDIIIHGDYDERDTTAGNDIALIRLRRPVPLNDKIQPVCLPNQTFDPTSWCVATGWGRRFSSDFIDIERHLREVRLPIINYKTCQKKYSLETIISTQICAGDSRSVDTCQGDSGGPLVCLENGKWFLSGITSWGYGCASGYPGVYTRVSSFVDWIQEISEQIN